MLKSKLKKYSPVICVVLAILMAIVLRQIGFRTEGFIKQLCCILRPLIYIGIFIIWGVSIRRRIIQPQVRRYLMAISVLMVFWVTARTTRYLFVETPLALRMFWYMYYFPMLFIPLLTILVAMSLGRPYNFRLPKWTSLLYIPTTALLLLVLTNDFHQLVFDFPDDAAVWNNDYSYAVGYFVILGCIVICALTAFVTMIIKCRIPNSRRFFILPLIPFITALVYGILFISRVPWLRVIAGDMTIVLCLFIASALEGCIRCGLIPTNTGYKELFKIGTIGARITDEEYHTRYASSNAPEISKDVMQKTENGSVHIDKDTLLKSSRIGGGYVLWKEDITDVTALLERLEENRKNIEDSNCLEEEDYKTKVKIHTLREKNRLYDRLQEQTTGQINILDELLNRYEKESDPVTARSLLARTGVIGAYIKRRGNLIFIEEKSEGTDTAELKACLEESFAGLKFMDVECALEIPEGQRIPVEGAIRVYDMFEAAIEAALDSLHSVWLIGRTLENAVVFCMEVESETYLAQLAHLADTCVREDGVWRFTLRVGKAGGQS